MAEVATRLAAAAREAAVTIVSHGPIDARRAAWNDRMYARHPTPYAGVAGLAERARVRAVLGLAAIRPEDAVLEIGCEAGRLLAAVPAARRVAGADISRRALEDAAALFRASGRAVELHQLDAEEPLPFARGEFDVVICSETLEHVARPDAVLGGIRAIATPRTRVVVSVPIEAPKLAAKAVLRRLGLLGLFLPGIEAERSEWHVHAFSGRMLRGLVAEHFEVLRAGHVWGLHYVALLRPKA